MTLPQIWVDADACPSAVKEILFRAAQRVEVPVTLVANHAIRVPGSPCITSIQVASGFDVADNHIVQHCRPGDLVITGDIPLAAELIDKGALALNPRGALYDKDTIRQQLIMRDFMEEMRSSGQVGGGPPPFSNMDRQAFANSLDRWLARNRADLNENNA